MQRVSEAFVWMKEWTCRLAWPTFLSQIWAASLKCAVKTRGVMFACHVWSHGSEMFQGTCAKNMGKLYFADSVAQLRRQVAKLISLWLRGSVLLCVNSPEEVLINPKASQMPPTGDLKTRPGAPAPHPCGLMCCLGVAQVCRHWPNTILVSYDLPLKILLSCDRVIQPCEIWGREKEVCNKRRPSGGRSTNTFSDVPERLRNSSGAGIPEVSLQILL